MAWTISWQGAVTSSSLQVLFWSLCNGSFLSWLKFNIFQISSQWMFGIRASQQKLMIQIEAIAGDEYDF